MEPSFVNSQLSFVSFHLNSTFVEVPLSISIPAFWDGVPVSLLFKVIILSASSIVSVLTVVVVPETVKSPVTVKSLPIVTSSGSATVIVSPDTDVTISLVVPATVNVSVPKTTPLSVPESAAISNVVVIEAVPAAVKRPSASTVNVGIADEEP